MASKKVIYEEVGIDLRDGKESLTVDEAKTLIGWITESEASEKAGKKVQFGNEYALRDLNGAKVRLTNNVTNRPHRLPLSKRYANEILRGKWKLNGETIVVDRMGHVQSGQHRLVGLILAEQMRQNDKEKWGTRAVVMPALVVVGINEGSDTTDTLDLGQKRTLADVLYRGNHFPNAGEKENKRLSGVLAGAARLVWLRAGGQDVSDAPHFPHSEALDFVEAHPKLKEAVDFVFTENAENAISSYVSLGYAAAILYLTGTAGTDPLKYREEGAAALDTSLWEKAEEFWVAFSKGDEKLHKLRTVLTNLDASGAIGRDEIVGTLINGVNLWLAGEVLDTKSLKVKKTKDQNGKTVLADRPRLGGLDAEVQKPVEPEPAPEQPAAKPQKGSKSRGGWKPGDTAWVTDPDGNHWFGTVTAVGANDDGKTADVEYAEDGNTYTVQQTQLAVKPPASVVAA